jgi:hypothetical protein
MLVACRLAGLSAPEGHYAGPQRIPAISPCGATALKRRHVGLGRQRKAGELAKGGKCGRRTAQTCELPRSVRAVRHRRPWSGLAPLQASEHRASGNEAARRWQPPNGLKLSVAELKHSAGATGGPDTGLLERVSPRLVQRLGHADCRLGMHPRALGTLARKATTGEVVIGSAVPRKCQPK